MRNTKIDIINLEHRRGRKAQVIEPLRLSIDNSEFRQHGV